MRTTLHRAGRALVLSASLAAGLATTVAEAQVTNRAANLRAGPDRDYPVVVTLAPGTPLEVRGCVDGYTWCDVSSGDFSGWVWAGSISYPYEGRPVPIYGYGAAIGLPIVVFSIGSYWDRYYTGRPFYRDRYRWEHHRPPPRPPYGRPPHWQPPPGRPVMQPGPGPRPIGGRPPGVRPGDGRPPMDGRPGGRPGGDHVRPPRGNGNDHHGRPPGMGGGGPSGHPSGQGGGRPHGGGGGRPPGGGGDHGPRNQAR